jgi:hypothetical protein
MAAERNLTGVVRKKGILAFSSEVGIEALRLLLVQPPSGSVTIFGVTWETYLRLWFFIIYFNPKKIFETIHQCSHLFF